MSTWRKYILGSWNWKRPFYSILSVYLLLLIVVIFFAENLIFFPPKASYTNALDGYNELANKEGQKVASIYKKARKDMPTLLWSHGNAEDINTAQSYMNWLHSEGYGIMIYDYTGYGLSDGKPDEAGCYHNIQAAWDHLTSTLAIPEKKIIIIGQSIGTGPSVWLAEKTNPAGLALLSPFKSINRIPFKINPFPYDRFPNIKRVENVTAPLLIIHGADDTVIPQAHGKALFEKHPGPKHFHDATGRGHNDLLSDQKVNKALQEFIHLVGTNGS